MDKKVKTRRMNLSEIVCVPKERAAAFRCVANKGEEDENRQKIESRQVEELDLRQRTRGKLKETKMAASIRHKML